MSTNFKIFDENYDNIMSDVDYAANTARENGVLEGIASSTLYNKTLRQVSVMVAAFAQVMSDEGETVSDADFNALVTSIETVFLPAPTTVFTTGMGMDFWGAPSRVPSGWVLAWGTIGDGSSGASNRANSDCQALFTMYWEDYNDTTAPIYTSGGVLSTRGASAAADWAAHKRITITDKRGRVSYGKDDMGGTAANRITSASTNGANSIILGGGLGSQTATISAANLPELTGTAESGGTHTHDASTSSAGTHSHTVTDTQTDLKSPNNLASGTGAVVTTGTGNDLTTNSAGSHTHTVTVTTTGSAHTHTVTVNTGGANTPLSTTTPGIVCNYMIKL